ncbi:hypothetical protein HaLaN_02310, partial [Haematococcus lacustris]
MEERYPAFHCKEPRRDKGTQLGTAALQLCSWHYSTLHNMTGPHAQSTSWLSAYCPAQPAKA